MMAFHRVERAQKDLEIQTEAAKLSAEFALKAKMIKVGSICSILITNQKRKIFFDLV